jgi:MoaA/NifB/PqqE/SkfB family radical SAM enzyme
VTAGSPYSPLKVFHHQDRLKVLRDGGQPAPIHLEWSLSDLCSHACSFCAFRWDGYPSNELFKIIEPDGRVNHNPNRMISYEKAIEVLDDCAAMGVKAVQFTGGGEPTLHPRHLDIFRAAMDRGLDIALVSHGNIFRPGYVDTMLRAKWVRYSLDAGRSSTYATVRKVPESAFHRTLNNVRDLCDARDVSRSELIIGIGFVVTKENWREVVDAARIAKDVGADNIRISAVFQPDDERYFEGFHQDVATLCREAAEMTCDGFHVFNNFGDRIGDLKQKSPDYSFCGQQHFTVFLGGDENLYRCCVTSFSPRGLIGSIKHQRLRDLWESDAKHRDYEQFDARGCERCMFNNKNRTINYALAREPAHVNFV